MKREVGFCMTKYEILDELQEVMSANVLTSERQANILAYDTDVLIAGLYEYAEFFADHTELLDVHDADDFWRWRNGFEGTSRIDLDEVCMVLVDDSFSLSYKRAMIGDMTEDEVRDYYAGMCEVSVSRFQYLHDFPEMGR